MLLNKKILILLVILTPLFLTAGLQIPSMFDSYSSNDSRMQFIKSELDAKNSLPSRTVQPIDVVIDLDSSGNIVLSPSSATVFMGVNNTICMQNNLDAKQTLISEDMFFHSRTFEPEKIHIFSISSPGRYAFYLEGNEDVKGEISVAPSILSQAYQFPKKFEKYFDDWKDPRGATTVRNYAFAQEDKSTQTWYDFYPNVPSDIDVMGIEVALLGSISGAMPAGVEAELMWGGKNYTDTGNTIMWNSSSVTSSVLGGSNDTWGHQWTAEDLKGENFGIKLKKIGDGSSTVNIDQIAIKVFLK